MAGFSYGALAATLSGTWSNGNTFRPFPVLPLSAGSADRAAAFPKETTYRIASVSISTRASSRPRAATTTSVFAGYRPSG